MDLKTAHSGIPRSPNHALAAARSKFLRGPTCDGRQSSQTKKTYMFDSIYKTPEITKKMHVTNCTLSPPLVENVYKTAARIKKRPPGPNIAPPPLGPLVSRMPKRPLLRSIYILLHATKSTKLSKKPQSLETCNIANLLLPRDSGEAATCLWHETVRLCRLLGIQLSCLISFIPWHATNIWLRRIPRGGFSSWGFLNQKGVQREPKCVIYSPCCLSSHGFLSTSS